LLHGTFARQGHSAEAADIEDPSRRMLGVAVLAEAIKVLTARKKRP
jgi:hypothetical protein